ncbi:PEP-CTERM sorting domain-containing protein [Thalassomonas haliotis]|uniref:PEP-CTERM sorting domain-containing protein n=1 Tax=Thalassomonas haliotis TaxID=485448 RepID=A0ABY7V8Q8_9GAMM|nr:PEP-CTERM sorting domain-containing protein [Thalassomonas haliotis]WDE09977.1 PEP-CTERM sorting domain-containing protein [Thalassomonas haliotis]
MKITGFRAALAASVISISCMANVTQAGIIDTDNDSFIDQDTQLEWMDFNVTAGQSHNSVVENLANGQLYDGWRLPTESEVITLHYNAFYDISYKWAEYPDSVSPHAIGKSRNDLNVRQQYGESSFQAVFDVMGGAGGAADNIHALFEDSNGDLGYLVWRNYDETGFDDHVTVNWGWGTTIEHLRTSTGATFSTMLVRGDSSSTTEVPEPSSLAILALGVVGLSLRRFKKHA